MIATSYAVAGRFSYSEYAISWDVPSGRSCIKTLGEIFSIGGGGGIHVGKSHYCGEVVTLGFA